MTQQTEDKSKYRVVLCGASAYDQKYYFNKQFDALPESVKEELHILCVLFTEDVGGVFTVEFDLNGRVVLNSRKDEGDLLYDDVGAPLLIGQVYRKKKELLRGISIYFRVTFLHEDPAALLEEEGDDD